MNDNARLVKEAMGRRIAVGWIIKEGPIEKVTFRLGIISKGGAVVGHR